MKIDFEKLAYERRLHAERLEAALKAIRVMAEGNNYEQEKRNIIAQCKQFD